MTNPWLDSRDGEERERTGKKEKKKKKKIKKTRDERGDMTNDTADMQGSIREYCEKGYNTEFNNLEGTDQCFGRHGLPSLNREEWKNLTRPISSMAMKQSSKTYQKVKVQDLKPSPVNSTKRSKKI